MEILLGQTSQLLLCQAELKCDILRSHFRKCYISDTPFITFFIQNSRQQYNVKTNTSNMEYLHNQVNLNANII